MLGSSTACTGRARGDGSFKHLTRRLVWVNARDTKTGPDRQGLKTVFLGNVIKLMA